MLKNSPNIGTGSITLRNDPRVTPVGKYLRKSKINELPQLINVLLGSMSVVGPRPQMEIDFKSYSKDIQKVIYNVRPGITGIGSIIFRDEERIISESDLPPREIYEKLIAPYKGALEVWYQKNISFYTDLMIILLTIWVILFPESDLHFKIFKDLPKRPLALVT
jgi:lipopolysaccharide/colanic/teichoic acid biosynthesis glycosyltransferase